MPDSTRPRPTIECKPNGPYLVTELPSLWNSRGEALPTRGRMALCRCGGSANKPFCDGTHARNGFSGDRLQAEPPASAGVEYRGKRVTITDNRSVCAHAGRCTDGLPRVWSTASEPWIDADGAEPEAIRAVVRACPSGALACSIDGVDCATPEREPAITVAKDGPYAVVGGPDLRDEVTHQTPASPEHYTLCRCGGSKNKPFCDGTHWHIGFRDEQG